MTLGEFREKTKHYPDDTDIQVNGSCFIHVLFEEFVYFKCPPTTFFVEVPGRSNATRKLKIESLK